MNTIPENSFVILASGAGSNARAIASIPELSSRLTAVVSDRKDSRVIKWAGEAGLAALHAPLKGLSRREADRTLLDRILPYKPDLVVLAGFMRILGPDFVNAFAGRIVNIHPSLLPRHPGLGAIERSWEAGDSRLGITIHLVDHGVDTGPVLAQASISRETFADISDAAHGIHELEHALYPAVVSRLLSRVASDTGDPARGSLPYRELQNVLPAHARLEIPAVEV